MILPQNINFWDKFRSINGALSTAESIAIMTIAKEAPDGWAIELGTHKGKSAMSAMIGLSKRFFTLVDPIFDDIRILDEVYNSIKDTNSEVVLKMCPLYSTEIIPKFKEYSFVFVDSGLHDDLVLEEVKMLEDRMIPKGIIAFHDYLNQFTAVERAYNYLLSTGKYEPIGINWQEIFDYVAEHNLEEGNNSWHQYPELPHPPNFVGALRRK